MAPPGLRVPVTTMSTTSVCDRNRDHAHSSRQGRADQLPHPGTHERTHPCVTPDPSARSGWRSSPPGLALVASSLRRDQRVTATRADSGKPMSDLRIMVPNTPGGGYDITARTAAKVMEDDDITAGTEVFNLDGAGGTVGLARTVNEKGNGDLAMMMGLGVVGASYTNKSQATLKRDHPDRPADRGVRRRDGVEGLAVQDHRRPRQGVEGGPQGDQRRRRLLARRAGPPAADAARPGRRHRPQQVNFVQYDGGGDLLPAILGDKVDVATSGAGEFKDQIANGDIRVLATSGDERIEGIDAPTFKESGIDLVFTNWRGIVAPPGISARAEGAARRRLHEDARDAGVEGRPGQGQQLGRRLPDQRRVLDLPHRAGPAGRATR